MSSLLLCVKKLPKKRPEVGRFWRCGIRYCSRATRCSRSYVLNDFTHSGKLLFIEDDFLSCSFFEWNELALLTKKNTDAKLP